LTRKGLFLPISLREVAARAGVSGATVSRVLNDVDVQIAPETRQRVKRVAAELGYQPNRTARALVTGRTRAVALWNVNMRSAYTVQIIYYSREEIIRHGYDLVITGAQSDGAVLDTSTVHALPVDGILAVDPPRGVIPGLEGSRLWRKALVSLGGYVLDDADFVRVDFTDAVIEAVRQLHRAGCARIAYLVPDWFEWFRGCDDARLRGYETVMREIGRAPEFVIAPNESRPSALATLKVYVERHGCPDGLFCFNDDMAIGAYRALRDLGRRIPDDVALVGCDGIEDMAYHDPPLATIVPPLGDMCARAWEYLERRIREPDAPLQQADFRPRFALRPSARG
jgi:LacI family transcriptional regulator